MKDAFAVAVFADLASFIGICVIVLLLLWGLSAWARHLRKIRSGREWHAWLRHQNRQQYPTISRADLDVELANCEAGYASLPEHIRHRNKFEGRHYDAA